MARDGITCTPQALLEDNSCTKCLSNSEKLAALAFILCKMVNGDVDADCTPETLQDAAKCFDCLSDSQLLDALVNAIYQYAVDAGYLVAGNLKEEAACLLCVKPRMTRAIIVYLVCLYLSNLGNPQ